MVLKLNDEKIAEYTFNDIDIGLEKFFQVKITSSMVDDFVRLSGDYNPLHTDKNFAKSNNFKSTVCHGMLLASFLSRLVGMYIPGKNGLYFSQSLNFINPGYIDDVITISGKVVSKSQSTKVITLKMSIKNSEHELIYGEAKVFLIK
jgi:acyl dehydratase|tara:strand:+ start:254 stop:694 length:441 start_codon:yes stop_codon:yes gene_type:complete